MAEENTAAGMEIDTALPQQPPPTAPAVESTVKPRFEIKKYNAVALWAWGAYCVISSCLSMLSQAASSLTLSFCTEYAFMIIHYVLLQIWLWTIAPFAVTTLWMRALSARLISRLRVVRTAMLHGAFATMPFITTAFPAG